MGIFIILWMWAVKQNAYRRWFQNISRHLSKYVTRRETNQCMRFTSLAGRDKDERRRFRELRPSRKLTDVQFTVIQ